MLAATVLVPVFAGTASGAVTFTVNSTDDTTDGFCSLSRNSPLREAIQAANATTTSVLLNGASVGAGANGLDVRRGNTTISKLVVNGLDQARILLQDAVGDVVRGSFLGVAGQRLTGTATDPNGSTSEFSACTTAVAGTP
jgi:hypothetical protein